MTVIDKGKLCSLERKKKIVHHSGNKDWKTGSKSVPRVMRERRNPEQNRVSMEKKVWKSKKGKVNMVGEDKRVKGKMNWIHPGKCIKSELKIN